MSTRPIKRFEKIDSGTARIAGRTKHLCKAKYFAYLERQQTTKNKIPHARWNHIARKETTNS